MNPSATRPPADRLHPDVRRPERHRARRLTSWWGFSAMVPVVLPVLGLAIVVAAWFTVSRWGGLPAIVLPPPQDVVVDLFERRERMLEQGWVTFRETVVGFGITAVGGILIGTVIARSRIIDQMVSPWLVALNAIPKVALAPMLVIWLGLNMKPRVAMVILLCFFPIVLATAIGLKSIPTELVELARSMDASRWQEFVKLRFPHALPQIFVGLKVAMPLAVIGAVVGEFAGGRTGLGFTIQIAGGFGDSAQAFAAITVVSLMGIALYYTLVLLERLLLPWVRATTG